MEGFIEMELRKREDNISKSKSKNNKAYWGYVD